MKAFVVGVVLFLGSVSHGFTLKCQDGIEINLNSKKATVGFQGSKVVAIGKVLKTVHDIRLNLNTWIKNGIQMDSGFVYIPHQVILDQEGTITVLSNYEARTYADDYNCSNARF